MGNEQNIFYTYIKFSDNKNNIKRKASRKQPKDVQNSGAFQLGSFSCSYYEVWVIVSFLIFICSLKSSHIYAICLDGIHSPPPNFPNSAITSLPTLFPLLIIIDFCVYLFITLSPISAPDVHMDAQVWGHPLRYWEAPSDYTGPQAAINCSSARSVDSSFLTELDLNLSDYLQ